MSRISKTKCTAVIPISMAISYSWEASYVITSNELSLDVASSREVRTAHELSTTRALAPTVETDSGRNGYRIFGNNMLHMQQCFDPAASTHVHACCVITNACSWCMCDAKIWPLRCRNKKACYRIV